MPYVSLLLGALAISIHFLDGAAERCQLDRAAISISQSYRFITCHLAHFGTSHLLWDVAVFLFLGLLCERMSPRRTILSLALSAALIPLAVLWLVPSVNAYRGLSGLDSTLFGLLATLMLMRQIQMRSVKGIVAIAGMLAAFMVKIAIEQSFGVAVFADSLSQRFVPVPVAHAVGLMVGMACGFGANASSDVLAGSELRA